MTPLRGLAGLLAAALLGAVVLGGVYAPKDGALMFAFTMGCGVPVILATHALVRGRRPRGSLARRFAVSLSVSAGLVTAGMVVIALLMFVSPHDALVMTLLALTAGGLTAYTTLVLSRDVIAQRDAGEKARRDLVAAVSHDLRTPLTSLRLLSDAVGDQLVDAPTRRRYLDQISLHIASLSALIEDLFELSRLEAGDIEWSMQQVALDELVDETITAMRAQAEAEGVAVSARVPAGLAASRANPEKLQRVLFNLIQNALRHTPADGSVTVLAEPRGSSVEIEVADSGAGLSADDRRHAFEPFYRGDANGAARSAGEGSGLGLTICRAIVEAHGGEIWFADSPAGARVRLRLPGHGRTGPAA